MTKNDLTLNELLVLNSEMRDSEKSLGLVYLMVLGGHLGLHRFFLKRYASAIAQLILFIVTVVLYIAMCITSAFENEVSIVISGVLFGLSALALTIWVIVDLFLIPGMIREFNEKIEQEIISKITALRQK